jgi:endogenous inhibitor of DNA gyrase (YacG/DUF329 family)
VSAVNTDKTAKVVQCPICQESVPWVKSQQFRPFCSERCKLIDLGDWASEGHRIPGNFTVTDEFLLDE